MAILLDGQTQARAQMGVNVVCPWHYTDQFWLLTGHGCSGQCHKDQFWLLTHGYINGGHYVNYASFGRISTCTAQQATGHHLLVMLPFMFWLLTGRSVGEINFHV